VKSGAWWPIAIVGVLGVTVVANIALLREAGAPGAAVVEPDYYRKALAWDTTMAQERASLDLGWRADARLAPAGAGLAEVTVTLAARDGEPVAGATVRVEAIHNADAGRFVTGALAERAPGRYAAILPLAHHGLWELRLDARRGPARYLASLRADLAPAPAAPPDRP